MARPRVEAYRLHELIRLRRQGLSARRIVRLLRISPKTELRYRLLLGRAGLLAGSPERLPSLTEIRVAVLTALPPPCAPRSTVDPWREEVLELLRKGLGARAIYDRLRLPKEGRRCFRGSYSAVKRFVRRLKRERGPRAEEVSIPIESVPGEAQVDFGYVGKLYDPARGVLRRAWVFVMLLTHSRLMFVRLVFDQKTETWLDLHEQAFRWFGGVAPTIVPDNTTRAVVRAAFGIVGPSELERSYREFGQQWGFRIDPAPPGQPRKRGKVEAAVKYLKNNLLKGRDGEAIDDVQRALDRWNREVASIRVHGSTGRRPLVVFQEDERAALLPLPAAAPERAIWRRAKVHPDGHVTCRGRLYSVPWQLIQERVWVRAFGRIVEVYHADRLVAHHVAVGRRRSTREEHLPQDRRMLRHRSRAYWEQRARAIGPETLRLIRHLFDKDEVSSHLRQVQAIVRHLEQFPALRAEAACRRALGTGDPSYRGLKRILARGLDLLS